MSAAPLAGKQSAIHPDVAAASLQGTLAELTRMIQVGAVRGPPSTGSPNSSSCFETSPPSEFFTLQVCKCSPNAKWMLYGASGATGRVGAVERLIATARNGALTPVQAFGADFALSVAGTRLQELSR